GGVAALQIAFTYVPLMNELFDTRPVPLLSGFAVILVRVALFAILEIEKRVQQRYGALIERSLLWLQRALRGSRRSMQRAAARLRRRLGLAPPRRCWPPTTRSERRSRQLASPSRALRA